MIYFTADLHFGHKNIIRLCKRPYGSLAEHDADLIKRWNDVVGHTDQVWVLGDMFCCCKKTYAMDVMRRLNGTKHLVMGNHDTWTKQWYHNCGFKTVVDRTNYWLGGSVPILMSHYPYRPSWLRWLTNIVLDPKANRYRCKHPTGRSWHGTAANEPRMLLHGHVHDKYARRGKQLNVGIDVWHHPIPEEVIRRMMKDLMPRTDQTQTTA
jgi:calcineurin-like phosphoesterase family protein